MATPSGGRQAIGQTSERRELLLPLMVVAHCLSLGRVPRGWVQQRGLCVGAGGVRLLERKEHDSSGSDSSSKVDDACMSQVFVTFIV